MAPIAVDPLDNDDFVRTISDDDFPRLSSDDDQESFSAKPSLTPVNSKKRKHGIVAGDAGKKVFNATLEGRKSKKVKHGEPTRGSHTDSEAQDEGNADAEGEDDGAINPDFEFEIESNGADLTNGFDFWDVDETGSKHTTTTVRKSVDIDELIKRRTKGKINGAGRNDEPSRELEGLPSGTSEDEVSSDESNSGVFAEDAFGMGAPAESLSGSEDSYESDMQSSDEEGVADPMPEVDEFVDSDKAYDSEEEARRKDFFAPEDPIPPNVLDGRDSSTKGFQSMSLSRPVLRGVASVGFTNPTPIQAKAIPLALQGKDVVGGAVTGSGKTGAFIIPILERLLFRPKKLPTSRVVVLVPTRELAVQCLNVAKKLASFTDISFCLLSGGFSLREQELVLRSRPDVIIATPGRFIDHMRNSASFTTDTLEILVLDEADRMLDDGFADELNEILSTIPKSRQTMLFSATMTDRVDKLIRVGLKKPTRVMADPRKQTVGTLVQEFVRLRPGREGKRIGYLLYLCSIVYKEKVIVFFRQKKDAHRTRVIFGLCGIKCAELHGSMSQEQRISALTSFRSNESTHLLATDLASRGLDIPHVSVVLNYEAPQSHEIYLHRVGRTARAGRAGRSCTIAGESDRKVVKQTVKAAKEQGAKIASRVIEPAAADVWAAKVQDLRNEIEEVLKAEKEEKLLNQSDMSIQKGENIIKYENEIQARPKRTWFESEKEKLKAKKAGREELNGRTGLGKKTGGGKLSGKEKKKLDDKRDRVEGRVWKKGKDSGAKEQRRGGRSSKSVNKSKSQIRGKKVKG